MLRNELFDTAAYGKVFDEEDRLLADASIRLASRLDPAPLEVSSELYQALLLLAKAVRHNHAAIDLDMDMDEDEKGFGRLFKELWTERDNEGLFQFVGDDVDPKKLVSALSDGDPRLVGREALEEERLSSCGSPIVLSTIEGSPRYATIRRYAQAECSIAGRLLRAATAITTLGSDDLPLPEPSEVIARADQERLKSDLEPLTSEDKKFLERAVTRSVSVLTGGPGTGKTTAIATLLHSLGLIARERGRPFRVAICAPTAKVAVRMREALEKAFGEGGMAEFVDELLIDPNSGSVHRLLEIRPDASVSTVELQCDLVIVDEVSMLEMTLLDQLLRCAGPSHVVLVGDPDQLVSVEVGAVLRDIVEAGEINSPLASIVTRLVVNHRSGDAINELAEAIHSGNPAEVEMVINAHPEAIVRAVTPTGHLESVIEVAEQIRASAKSGDVNEALDRLQSQVVLCGNREGDWSVSWWRAKVRGALARSASADDDRARFAVGTPIMMLKNEHAASKKLEDRLCNGDVGVVCAKNDGTEVYFLPTGARYRSLRVIDDAEPAWSFTIHKSQGSEYKKVIVSLPARRNRILTRELLYTAVTRAIEKVVIIGSNDVFAQALAKKVNRVSSLTARIVARSLASQKI